MEDERRQTPRIPVEIPVTLTDGSKTQGLLACDVSLRGMFIRSDAPSPLRRIIRLDIPISDGPDLQVLAMVVHRVTPEQASSRGVPPGMGVHLYGVGSVARTRWTQYLEELQQQQPKANERRLVVPPKLPGPPPVDAIKRRHVRYSVELDVQLIGASVERSKTRDVSLGGAFVHSSGVWSVGERIDAVLLHPETGAGFDVPCTVARVVGGPKPGIGLEFLALDEEKRAALQKFVEGCLPDSNLDDELVVLEQDDPLFA